MLRGTADVFAGEASWGVDLGDVRDVLKAWPAESVQCCVTSPPYWSLRDYGCEGQLGLEPTPEAYVAAMVDVFREVRRVLSEDGTVWLNIGDGYNANQGAGFDTNGDGDVNGRKAAGATKRIPWGKQKDLVGAPWLLAFGLRADGWYLRSDIIWHKPNPMPESITDRPTKGHEYLFLLSKSPRYYYDADAIAEPAVSVGGGACFGKQNHDATGSGQQSRTYDRPVYETRNRRSVWTIPTQSYHGAHFAVMPPKLVEPCILAGSRRGDIVADPFAGSGTTLAVAVGLGRRAVGCELNADYLKLIAGRISETTPSFC